MLKKLSAFLLLVCFSVSQVSAAFVEKKAVAAPPANATEANADQQKSNLQAFMSLNRKTYKEMTGKKLSLKESLQLKLAQKMMKKQANKPDGGGGSLPQWAYIVLSIIALGWLAIGVKSNWQGNDWWISLLLYFCFIIPGIIYSLIVMKKYY